MSAIPISGVAWVLLGGILNGSFVLPMKRMPVWRWEIDADQATGDARSHEAALRIAKLYLARRGRS